MVKIPMKRGCYMRLYSTYFICKNLLETLKGVEFKRQVTNSQIYTIPNWADYKEAREFDS